SHTFYWVAGGWNYGDWFKFRGHEHDVRGRSLPFPRNRHSARNRIFASQHFDFVCFRGGTAVSNRCAGRDSPHAALQWHDDWHLQPDYVQRSSVQFADDPYGDHHRDLVRHGYGIVRRNFSRLARLAPRNSGGLEGLRKGNWSNGSKFEIWQLTLNVMNCKASALI